MIRFKCLFIALLTLVPLVVSAQQLQKLYIESFVMDPLDQAPKKFPKTDVNGDLYALVKVRPSADKFLFKFGLMKSLVDEGNHPGETWIYVQKNARRITITRDGFEPIMNVDLGLTLESATAYVLNLSFVEPTLAVEKQYLQFLVSPADSRPTVKVRKTGSENYEIWGQPDANGSIARYVECGRYDYQIVAENYLMSEGFVLLNTPNETLEERVELVPDFGYLQVDDAYGIAGAQLYVNDRLIGTIPYTEKEKWQSGTYTLSVTNGDLYKTYSETFTITNGKTTVLKPKLESLAAETKLVVEADAEIYIDKVLKGTRYWSGPLREGRYEVECRMESHESTFKTIEVKAEVSQTVLLDAPRPRVGSIAVNTSPSYVRIVLDGKEAGHTPRVLENVLIGSHTLELALDNYKTEQLTVDVKEGRTAEVQVQMSTMAQLTIDSEPSSAYLTLNGEPVGTTPYTAEMASGDYDLMLEKRGYETVAQTVHLDASQPVQTFRLKRQLARPTCVYVQPTFQAGSLMAIGGVIGGYIANINLEAGYLKGMGESEQIFWNYTGGESWPPRSEYLKVSWTGGKVGYGITLGRSLRITPQAGAGVVSIVGEVSQSYAVTASVGVRAEYHIVNHIGVSLAPEYGFAVKKAETFDSLSAISSTIGGWASGFNARIGVFFSF